MRNFHVYALACCLALFGIGMTVYKVFVTGLPLTPGRMTSAWEIEKRIAFDADGGPVKLAVGIPRSDQKITVMSESVIAPGYGVSKSKKEGSHRITLAKREAAGKQTVYLRSVVSTAEKPEKVEAKQPPPPQMPDLSEAQMAAGLEILEAAEKKSSDVPTMVIALLKSLSDPETLEKVTEPGTRGTSKQKIVEAAVKLLSAGRINARRVSGIDLASGGQNIAFESWLEVYNDNRWIGFTAAGGEAGVPDTYMAWSRGGGSTVSLTGGSNTKVDLSVIRLEQAELMMALQKGSSAEDKLIKFSLFGLPVKTQEVYRVLVVVPLGILLLVVLRNIVGVKSLGTFMPVLIALAFRETQLVWGIILFGSVVATGLLFRFYLEQLKLLLVPRIAAVLIFVLMLMAVLSVLTNALGFERGLSVALFPMVILAMTIERVSVLWDERGAKEAIMQAIGSLMIAALCYLVMTIPLVEHVFFTFPELLLVLLAVTILIGRYTGYRLLELRRFEALAKEHA